MKKSSINVLCLFAAAWLLFLSNEVRAQHLDYSKQILAIKNAFHEKSIAGLQGFISPGLKFDPIPAEKTPAVLEQVVKQFPELDSLKVLEIKDGFASVKYYFKGTRGSESGLYFDKLGKISRIELIEQVIQKQVALSKSVPQPSPGDLGGKYPFQPVTFESKDGLQISGNLYEADPHYPIILLCHQAMFNKYEYADIAPKLNQLGFNCLAIDQRSGGPFAGHENETFNRAVAQGLNTDFLEAQQDIEAAISYLNKRYHKKVTVWGSSYSSILVLFLANNKNVNAVVSFSPSDFFEDERPPIKEVIAGIKKPYLITSSKKESEKLSEIMAAIPRKTNQIQFVPKSDGFHGSRSLWEGQQGATEYWSAVKGFLATVYTGKK